MEAISTDVSIWGILWYDNILCNKLVYKNIILSQTGSAESENNINPYSARIDVCRRQILTSKDNPRTDRITKFHRYSNEAERVCDDFKVKKIFYLVSMVYTKIFQRCKC